jgi:hypothetical protein
LDERLCALCFGHVEMTNVRPDGEN